MWSKVVLLLSLATVIMMSCKDKPLPGPDDEDIQASEETQKVNKFIQDVMDLYYLWYDEMPDIDIRYETDPAKFYNKLLYKDDKWSYITDDAKKTDDSSHGIEKTFGYSLSLGDFSNSDTYFAIIEYVYPNSPAERAGLMRGDFIVMIDGEEITKSNLGKLWDAETITITKGVYSSSGISLGNDISMTAENLTMDPVLMYKTIDKDSHKVGYLCYTQFIPSYNSTSLHDAFQYFKENSITDLVVDLRYNPGGYIAAAQYLCSSIAPSGVDHNSTLVTLEFNNQLSDYWNTTWYFLDESDDTPPVKLGLNKVYFLTGHGTASASELSITGLDAYMDVVTVGDTTYGKYTAALFFTPDSIYTNSSYTSDIANWGIQPIIAKYSNALGVTDFKDGLVPDFYVNEYSAANIPFAPLGETDEPLLQKALEDITGIPVQALKKAEFPYSFNVKKQGISRHEDLKRNLLLTEKDLKPQASPQ